jgi:hypothetical protein
VLGAGAIAGAVTAGWRLHRWSVSGSLRPALVRGLAATPGRPSDPLRGAADQPRKALRRWLSSR